MSREVREALSDWDERFEAAPKTYKPEPELAQKLLAKMKEKTR